MNKTKISIVIPCYYAEKSITGVVEKTARELDKYYKYSYEFILVNDGSDDNTFSEIIKLSQKYYFVKGIDLAKNCGQHNAILAGMKCADGDYILGMDDDFQTHPSQIYKLISKIEEGYDIVYGKFPFRHHSFIRNMESKLNDLTVRYLIGKPKDLKACPMYIIRRFVRDEVIKSNSAYTNLQGLFLRSSSRIVNVEIEHFDRKYGKSGYTLKKLLRLWSSFLNYSVKPIQLILSIGVVLSILGIVYMILAILLSMEFQHKIYSEIIIFSGMIISSLGIIGTYVVRLFMSVTYEPQYVIRSETGKSTNEVNENEKKVVGSWSR